MSTPSLNINILGAGIAGVATAIPLAHAGHTVTIFESRDALREVGAGLQIQSNATRILHAWGLDKALRPLANKPGVLRVLRYEDDSVIGEVAHNPIQEWEYGFPHWNLYRPDLHRVLLKAAVEAGAEVKFGCRAVGANVEQGVIEFADGSKAGDADLVVVADGILSTIRELLPGNESAKAASCGEFCFRAAIDKANMDDDPETAELMKSNDCSVWCGPGTLVLGYTVRSGT